MTGSSGCFVKLTSWEKRSYTFYAFMLHLHVVIIIWKKIGKMDKVNNRFWILPNFENLLVWLYWRHCGAGEVAQGVLTCTGSASVVYNTPSAASVTYNASKATMTRSENHEVKPRNWKNYFNSCRIASESRYKVPRARLTLRTYTSLEYSCGRIDVIALLCGE